MTTLTPAKVDRPRFEPPEPEGNSPLAWLLESRFWALARKEINQILRNRQLVFLLVFPPTIQLLVFGFALSPDVRNLKLGIADENQTHESRDFIASFTSTGLFLLEDYRLSDVPLAQEVRTGALTAALVIPPNFARDLKRGRNAEVQLLIDAVDANTAGITAGYTSQIVNAFNRDLLQAPRPLIDPEVSVLYNPGLKSSWFFVPGVIGLVLTLTSTLVSLATLIREKDVGTLEQLLMTPAAAWEILLAKIVPLFFLLLGELMLALTMARVIFGLPFRGNFFLFVGLSGVYICVGMAVGMLLATLCRSQQQAQLATFFINLPLIQTAGAIAPIESMPTFFQVLSLFNPLRHYIIIVRGILLKGVGIEVLWPDVLALFAIAVVLLSVSISRFRSQLT